MVAIPRISFINIRSKSYFFKVWYLRNRRENLSRYVYRLGVLNITIHFLLIFSELSDSEMDAFVDAYFAIDTGMNGVITSKELTNYMKENNYGDAFVKVRHILIFKCEYTCALTFCSRNMILCMTCITCENCIFITLNQVHLTRN